MDDTLPICISESRKCAGFLNIKSLMRAAIWHGPRGLGREDSMALVRSDMQASTLMFHRLPFFDQRTVTAAFISSKASEEGSRPIA